jgi:hypothetical protein
MKLSKSADVESRFQYNFVASQIIVVFSDRKSQIQKVLCQQLCWNRSESRIDECLVGIRIVDAGIDSNDFRTVSDLKLVNFH